MGYNKTLPQIALGQSQSSILATINFENDVLHLAESMIPPMMSSTMNANVLRSQQGNSGGSSQTQRSSSDGAGRPEKADNEKSDKTIANREAEGK